MNFSNRLQLLAYRPHIFSLPTKKITRFRGIWFTKVYRAVGKPTGNSNNVVGDEIEEEIEEDIEQ